MELQIEHLCKTYRKKEALQDVSFTLHKGIYGLLGENSGWSYREQWDNFMIWPEEDGIENRLTLRFWANEIHLGFPYTPYAGSVTIVSSAGKDGSTWDLRCPERKKWEAVQYADFSFDSHHVYSPLELLLYGAGILPDRKSVV